MMVFVYYDRIEQLICFLLTNSMSMKQQIGSWKWIVILTEMIQYDPFISDSAIQYFSPKKDLFYNIFQYYEH